MGEKCEKELCAHYVNRGVFHVYRHKFLWTIVIASVLAIAGFAGIIYSFIDSHKKIVNANSTAIERIELQLSHVNSSKDSLYNVDEQLIAVMNEYMTSMESLLELESTKIQSDYILLSLWAGILMIVFLVYSIYSMYKTDEVLRQSKVGLDAVESAEKRANEAIRKVEDKANEEISNVSHKAKEENDKIQISTSQIIAEVKGEMEKNRVDFENDVNAKAQSFDDKYKKLMEQMDISKRENTELFKSFVKQVQDSNAEQKNGVEEIENK